MSTTEQLPRYDSAARPLLALEELEELWRYRDLLVQLVRRDVTTRYRRSVLGIVWTMLNPILLMSIFTLIFSQLFRFDTPNYPVYVLSGLVIWNFIAQSSSAAMSQLVWGGPLLAKVYVPRTIFALTAVGTGLVNLVLALVTLVLIGIVTGVEPTLSLLTIVIPVIFATAFTAGLGLLLSTIAIEFRDIIEMYQVLVSAWFFLTPVMYPVSILPDAYRTLIKWNPTYYLVEAFRSPIYRGTIAEPGILAGAFAVSVGMLLLGWFLYTRRADDIPYRV